MPFDLFLFLQTHSVNLKCIIIIIYRKSTYGSLKGNFRKLRTWCGVFLAALNKLWK